MNKLDYFFRLDCSGLPFLALVLAVLVVTVDVAASQEPHGVSCSQAAEISNELVLRKDKLIKLKGGLEAFVSGKQVTDIPLTALFMIDLTDDKAVAQRVEELQRETAAAKDPNQVQDPLLVCALSIKDLKASALEVIQLQNAIAYLRLQFLTLAPEKMVAILHPQLEATAQANTVKQLQEDHSSALEEQQQAAESLARVEQQALAAEAGTGADLIAKRAELERSRGELTALQVTWVSDTERQVLFYKDISEQLAEIAKFLLQPESTAILKTEYEKSLVIWRTLVDKTPKVVSSRYAFAIPSLPDYPEKLLDDVGDTPETRQYKEAYDETRALRESLQNKIGARQQESVDLHYRLLLQSGEIRSQLLNLLLDRGDHSHLDLSSDLLQDIRREFTIVPYRWSATFYLRMLDIRRRFSLGWEGLAETATNIAILIVFLLIPWAIWVGTKRLTQQLIHLRVRLVRQSRTHPYARNLALAIQKILPYSSWLIMLLAIHIAQELLSLTVFAELALLLPYLRYYIYYRLFRLVMQCDFLWVNHIIRAAKLWNLRRQVNTASKVLGLSALLIFSFLIAIESLIRRGLIYHYATLAMLDFGILIIIVLAYQWRSVIGGGLARLIPGALGQKLANLCNSRWGVVIAIPAFLVLFLLLILRQLGSWSKHFEFARRIASELFRYQLETAIEKSDFLAFTPPPSEYRQFFTLNGIAGHEQLMQPGIQGFDTINELISNWQSTPIAPNSLVITGCKGTGKTCLLDYLEQNPPAKHIIRGSVPEKMTGSQQVQDFFGKLLNVSLSENANPLQTTDLAGDQTLLLIDDAHNIFLATEGGFAGYNTLLELINQSPRTFFWCLVFNYHTWNYLNNVYKKEQYFGSVVCLTPWSEQAIQELILSTHALTGFRLSYDDIIQAVGNQVNSEHVTHIESRFFSLLRQQSRGNPRLATYLWLSSLRLIGDKALRVGLPDESQISALSDLPENALFVFASIARHENLTLIQAVATTQLSEGAVKTMLDLGVHLKLLDCENDRIYRLAILYQYPLINYLQAKHCLYE